MTEKDKSFWKGFLAASISLPITKFFLIALGVFDG